MRIIHCADLHLDSKLTSHLPLPVARQRRIELLQTFQNMVRYADTNGVEAIIIAGDLFDSKNTSALARNTVYQALIDYPQIQFYYLKGNHDADSFLASLDQVPDNLYMFDHEWTYYHAGSLGATRIVIAGIELSRENADRIDQSLALSPDAFNIVVLHGQEANAIVKHRAENINLKALRNKGIDYLALGHIHKYKQAKLDHRGVYCYSGCLEARGFDEIGDHGFVLLEIDENLRTFSHQFIPAAQRQFYQQEVDISGCLTTGQMIDKIRQDLEKTGISQGDMLKLVLIGQIDISAEKNLAMIDYNFKDKFFLFKLSDQTKWQVNYQDYRLDQSLKGEFVRLVELKTDISQDQKAAIIQYGLLALAGEEIE